MKKERVRTKREDGGRGDPRGRDEAKGWLGRAGSKGERNNPRPRAASAACPRLLAWRHQRLASRWPTISSILAWHASLSVARNTFLPDGAHDTPSCSTCFHFLDEMREGKPSRPATAGVRHRVHLAHLLDYLLSFRPGEADAMGKCVVLMQG